MARPKRSWLFVPGTDEQRMRKAAESAADALIVDLEDAVAISEKKRARGLVRAFLHEQTRDRQIYVRVNDLRTGWTFEDIEAVTCEGLAGIILPKVEAVEAIVTASAYLDTCERQAGIAPGQVRLNAIIETARGILFAGEIAFAGGGRLDTMMFGAGDYTADLGIATSNVGPHITHGKVVTAVACRAAGLQEPIDTVFFDLQDEEGFAADCRDGYELGFAGKAVIHPRQIEGANAAYTPTPTAVKKARRLLEAFQEAEKNGLGAVQLDGKLVDYAMLRTAQRTISLANAI